MKSKLESTEPPAPEAAALEVFQERINNLLKEDVSVIHKQSYGVSIGSGEYKDAMRWCQEQHIPVGSLITLLLRDFIRIEKGEKAPIENEEEEDPYCMPPFFSADSSITSWLKGQTKEALADFAYEYLTGDIAKSGSKPGRWLLQSMRCQSTIEALRNLETLTPDQEEEMNRAVQWTRMYAKWASLYQRTFDACCRRSRPRYRRRSLR